VLLPLARGHGSPLGRGRAAHRRHAGVVARRRAPLADARVPAAGRLGAAAGRGRGEGLQLCEGRKAVLGAPRLARRRARQRLHRRDGSGELARLRGGQQLAPDAAAWRGARRGRGRCGPRQSWLTSTQRGPLCACAPFCDAGRRGGRQRCRGTLPRRARGPPAAHVRDAPEHAANTRSSRVGRPGGGGPRLRGVALALQQAQVGDQLRILGRLLLRRPPRRVRLGLRRGAGLRSRARARCGASAAGPLRCARAGPCPPRPPELRPCGARPSAAHLTGTARAVGARAHQGRRGACRGARRGAPARSAARPRAPAPRQPACAAPRAPRPGPPARPRRAAPARARAPPPGRPPRARAPPARRPPPPAAPVARRSVRGPALRRDADVQRAVVAGSGGRLAPRLARSSCTHQGRAAARPRASAPRPNATQATCGCSSRAVAETAPPRATPTNAVHAPSRPRAVPHCGARRGPRLQLGGLRGQARLARAPRSLVARALRRCGRERAPRLLQAGGQLRLTPRRRLLRCSPGRRRRRRRRLRRQPGLARRGLLGRLGGRRLRAGELRRQAGLARRGALGRIRGGRLGLGQARGELGLALGRCCGRRVRAAVRRGAAVLGGPLVRLAQLLAQQLDVGGQVLVGLPAREGGRSALGRLAAGAGLGGSQGRGPGCAPAAAPRRLQHRARRLQHRVRRHSRRRRPQPVPAGTLALRPLVRLARLASTAAPLLVPAQACLARASPAPP